MHLSKLHGLGNDFLVLLEDGAGAPVPTDEAGLVDLARRLCDRHRGIGADGLIVGARPDRADGLIVGARPDRADGGVDVVMHLHNADGSRAEMSGNGIRCLAHAVVRARGERAGTVVAATDAGLRTLEVAPGGHDGEALVRVGMGSVAPGPAVPPGVVERLGEARHATVDVGNPHLVVLVDDPLAVDLRAEGPPLEAAFPAGINVEFVAPTADGLVLTVWERGAGITEACGTGACAATAAAHRWGVVGDRAEVRMPGGVATVELDGDEVTLVGPSEHIADVEVPR